MLRLGNSILILGFCLTLISVCPGQHIVADHSSVGEFYSIPPEDFQIVVDDYPIFYATASHGSQQLVGMIMLNSVDSDLYPAEFWHYHGGAIPPFNGDSFVQVTRNYLDANPHCRIVIWNWCWGHETGVDAYLTGMVDLENEYPEVAFVYSTGRLNGHGPDGNVYINNSRIREHCIANNKILYDFADIESYDPDGNYYPFANDGGTNWVYDWIDANPDHPWPNLEGYQSEAPGLETNDCEWQHAHCFMCYSKGKALWWLLAKIAGWDGMTHIGETDRPFAVDETDRPFSLEQNWPNPFNPSTSLSFTVESAGDIRLDVFDYRGRLVTTLVHQTLDIGRHQFTWNGDDRAGRPMSSGTYFYRVTSVSRQDTRKMTLLR